MNLRELEDRMRLIDAAGNGTISPEEKKRLDALMESSIAKIRAQIQSELFRDMVQHTVIQGLDRMSENFEMTFEEAPMALFSSFALAYAGSTTVTAMKGLREPALVPSNLSLIRAYIHELLVRFNQEVDHYEANIGQPLGVKKFETGE